MQALGNRAPTPAGSGPAYMKKAEGPILLGQIGSADVPEVQVGDAGGRGDGSERAAGIDLAGRRDGFDAGRAAPVIGSAPQNTGPQ